MRVETRKQFIPATSYDTTVYIADDGKEFSTSHECERYERNQILKRHPVAQSAIEGLNTYYGNITMTLYFIRNEDDLNFLKNEYLRISKWDTDYKKHGSGWYIYYVLDGGDGPDFHHLFNWEAYRKEIEESSRQYIRNVERKMFDHVQDPASL